MNMRILQEEGLDKPYIAFVYHTGQAKNLKHDNPQIARIHANLAQVARNLLSQDVLLGVVQYRIHGTRMRIDHAPADTSRHQFRARMRQVPVHAVERDFASALLEMFAGAGVNFVALPSTTEGTLRLMVIGHPETANTL